MKLESSYDVKLQCVSRSELIKKMEADQSTSTRTVLGIGGQRITSDMLNSNIMPSMPMYQSGLKLVMLKNRSESFWTFFKPISWEVALAYLALVILVSALIWVMEERTWSRKKITHAFNYLEIIYDVFSGFFFTNLVHLRRVSSRIILWFFWFTTFIFLALYQANLTQKISESYTFNKANSFNEGLNGNYKFGCLDSYQTQMTMFYPDNITQFSFYTTTNVSSSIASMFSDLESGLIDGVILESPLADYFSSLYCSSNTIDGLIWSFNYVQLFAAGTLSTRVSEFNQKLSKSKQSLPVSGIKLDVFDATGLTTCEAPEEKIRPSELAGLWIILGISLIVSLLVLGIQKIFKFNLSKHAAPSYSKFQNKKNDHFEEQLRDKIRDQIGDILKQHKDSFINQIDAFERTLMLQEELIDEDEGAALNASPLVTRKDLETEGDYVGAKVHQQLASQGSERMDTSQQMIE